MPGTIVCTRAIKGGSFSNEPGPTRFLKTHPVVDSISHGWYFDDPIFLEGFAFTLADDVGPASSPFKCSPRKLSLFEK